MKRRRSLFQIKHSIFTLTLVLLSSNLVFSQNYQNVFLASCSFPETINQDYIDKNESESIFSITDRDDLLAASNINSWNCLNMNNPELKLNRKDKINGSTPPLDDGFYIMVGSAELVVKHQSLIIWNNSFYILMMSESLWNSVYDQTLGDKIKVSFDDFNLLSSSSYTQDGKEYTHGYYYVNEDNPNQMVAYNQTYFKQYKVVQYTFIEQLSHKGLDEVIRYENFQIQAEVIIKDIELTADPPFLIVEDVPWSGRDTSEKMLENVPYRVVINDDEKDVAGTLYKKNEKKYLELTYRIVDYGGDPMLVLITDNSGLQHLQH